MTSGGSAQWLSTVARRNARNIKAIHSKKFTHKNRCGSMQETSKQRSKKFTPETESRNFEGKICDLKQAHVKDEEIKHVAGECFTFWL